MVLVSFDAEQLIAWKLVIGRWGMSRRTVALLYKDMIRRRGVLTLQIDILTRLAS